ncbi:MAG: bifunctional UDP-N-acetylglucosamine diphosphorylase/glucosamine-1-phosphate N-acetyltransferase GlmU [Thermoleophilaceae bacterium]
MAQQPTALIMAAGHGTRMRSALPKVLHPVCGRPMIAWVIAAAREAGADPVLCVTRPGEGVAGALPDGAQPVEQTEGEGTGAAVLAAADSIDPDATLVILSGDHPLVSRELVEGLIESHRSEGAVATLLTTEEIDPTGYGRIVRGPDGSVERIVETKYTEGVPPEELAIREINIGAYAFSAGELLQALGQVGEENGEIYLTGVFPIMRERGLKIAAYRTRDASSSMGVNTRVDLIGVEEVARQRLIERHALAGVSFTSPETVTIDAEVEIGQDTVVGPGVSLHGATRIGAGCELGPHSTIVDAVIGDRSRVLHSYLSGCELAGGVSVGPFAYLRPGARIGESAKVGTFVEIKNSNVGAGAKVPHLSYIGDADIGDRTNVGAGNITANYDGRRKHRTVIGEDVKTGVDTAFVAPVRVGSRAYTGAGSVITEDVPDGALGIARQRQSNVEGYAERADKESSE